MKKKILRPLLFSLGLFLSQQAAAQTVTVRVSGGQINTQVKQHIEQQSSQLLTSFNESIIEDGKKMKDKLKNTFPVRTQSTKDVSSSIMEIWEQSPINCFMSQLDRPILTLYTNNVYQMRNVPVSILAANEDEMFQELVLSFDSEGNLTEVNFALDKQFSHDIIPAGIPEDDLSHRQMIQDFLELYFSAYIRKDYSFIKLLLSEDCLSLFGTNLRKLPNDNVSEMIRTDLGKEGYKQMNQRKKEYLSQLQKSFSKEAILPLHIENLTVKQASRRQIYFVTLHQSWTSSIASISSTLTLSFNFSDPLNPIIEVRNFD